MNAGDESSRWQEPREQPAYLWEDYARWWRERGATEGTRSLTLYEQHPIISAMTQASNSLVGVIDLPSMQYIYLSPNLAEFLGRDDSGYRKKGVAYNFHFVHPDDRPGIVAFSQLITNHFKHLSDAQRKSYRSFWDFRLLGGDGKYFRILQQDCVLKYSADGRMEERLFVATKIDSLIPDDGQHLRMTYDRQDLFFLFDHQKKELHQLQLLSKREIEVAQWISKSFPMKEIASLMNISFNTVKVHRANMMEKLRVKDSIEMIQLLRVWGFI